MICPDSSVCANVADTYLTVCFVNIEFRERKKADFVQILLKRNGAEEEIAKKFPTERE
jgi:hypothetical protein